MRVTVEDGTGTLKLSVEEQANAARYDREEQLANATERVHIKKLRKLLGSKLTTGRHSQYPEVVGDINLLRYLRGSKNDINKAAKIFTRHLAQRSFHNLDDVRDKYYPMISSRSAFDYGYQQEELVWGEIVRAYLPMTTDAPLTERGDVICGYWYVSGRFAMLLQTHGYDRVMAYTRELSICRQIQLDLLSRAQNRLVRIVIMFHAPHGGVWRLATSGPTRQFFLDKGLLGYTMSSTMPTIFARGFIMDDSWGVSLKTNLFFSIELFFAWIIFRLTSLFTPSLFSDFIGSCSFIFLSIIVACVLSCN
jgi:hypothetical protein